MQQLLDHQRDLRAVVPPTGATARLTPSYGLIDYSLLEQAGTATAVLDLTRVESGGAAGTATNDVTDVHARLSAIQRDLNDARRRAFDAVLSLDDRLAEIERAITEVTSQIRELD